MSIDSPVYPIIMHQVMILDLLGLHTSINVDSSSKGLKIVNLFLD